MNEPKPNQIYQHFKGKEKLYKILEIARDCENPEKKIVIYQQLYESEFPKGTIWARSLEDFVGYKKIENNKEIKRFILIK
ncbi:MAG: DUF1653 domain-containing protein [Nanoarchaeota archaeon]|nr:DUF1653 domain-containing protein [Nanoarchaeota archaeon]